MKGICCVRGLGRREVFQQCIGVFASKLWFDVWISTHIFWDVFVRLPDATGSSVFNNMKAHVDNIIARMWATGRGG